MNLLHLSNADIAGGAAAATYQLHTLLRGSGHRSVMAVRQKHSSDPDVIPLGVRPMRTYRWAERYERIQARLSGGYGVASLPFCPFNRNLAPVPNWDSVLQAMPRPDVLFLHWTTNLLTVADIRRLAERVTCPIVWILLDMEPMTGGCHYPGTCTRFHDECRDCPQLQVNGRRDWARRTWQEKYRLLTGMPITFLAPSKWLRHRLANSGLFREHRIVEIPLPMNERMSPSNRAVARQILGVPAEKKVVLAGCQNLKSPRKGMDRLIAAARVLEAQGRSCAKQSGNNSEVLFLLMGTSGHAISAELPFPSKDTGYIRSDVELSLMYQAADVFACPSLEDAGPMMVSQAMLCGTPVVAFDTGIVPELIVTGENGYVARLGDAEDFAHGLDAMLTNDGSAGRRAAESAARHHDQRLIVDGYRGLLDELKRRASQTL